MNAWLVRPQPNNVNKVAVFRSKNIVAIGWPELGDFSNTSREQIKELLAASSYQLEGIELGSAYATIDIFVNQMKEGDLILMPDGADIYFGKLVGSYFYNSAIGCDDENYPHQRKVEWLSDVSRGELSKGLRSSLKVHRTTANLSQHVKEIDALAHGKQPTVQTKDIPVAYPLRSDYTVTFQVPADLTADEARRLSEYFLNLYFKKKE